MGKLVDLMHLCIKHDAIFEISGGNVKVIKYEAFGFQTNAQFYGLHAVLVIKSD